MKTIPTLLLIPTLILIGGFTPVSAEKSSSDYIADLNSDNPQLQREACRALGEKQVKEAVPNLITLLENSKDNEVQWNAALALGLIKVPGPATDALLKAAREGKTKAVRYAALLALANIQDKAKLAQYKEIAEWTRTQSDDDLARDLVERYFKEQGI